MKTGTSKLLFSFKPKLLTNNSTSQKRFHLHRLETGQATIFAQGAIHFEMNLGCEPVRFIAAFGSADPGTTQVAQAFFQEIPEDVVNAVLGGVEKLGFDKGTIPANVAFGWVLPFFDTKDMVY